MKTADSKLKKCLKGNLLVTLGDFWLELTQDLRHYTYNSYKRFRAYIWR